ncbi:Fe-S assembly SUF system protein [Bacteroidia bacterium]|nr:Fe-S assembly SUF system protein [Bacteroidia bacterium]GHU94421.1 Fe-S assembly SUF system protein [Bacteroidia bacterium]
MNADQILAIQQDIIRVLKNIYDPEIPVSVYALGLIYEINVSEEGNVVIMMTLTAPNCPIADQIVDNVREEVSTVPRVASVVVNLVFDPMWNQDMMSEEAKLELGFM